MRNIFSNKLLGLLLVLLLVFVIFIMQNDEKSERSYRKNLVSIDTIAVSKIRIQAPQKDFVELSKLDNVWKVSVQSQDLPVAAGRVKAMLDEIVSIKPARVAALGQKKWSEFQVSKEQSTRLEIFESNEKTLDLHVGKISFKQNPNQQMGQQQQPQISTYVRLEGENEVYVTNNFLQAILASDSVAYIDSTQLNMSADSLSTSNN